jgi:hypothetical protein
LAAVEVKIKGGRAKYYPYLLHASDQSIYSQNHLSLVEKAISSPREKSQPRNRRDRQFYFGVGYAARITFLFGVMHVAILRVLFGQEVEK